MITQTCTVSGQSFSVREEDKAFYQKVGVDIPTLHPDEMLRSMMLHRNEKVLFRRHCDKTGKPLISAYDKDVDFPVYANEIWWGDTWDAIEYGKDYNFSNNFFDQFKYLQERVPREGTSVFNSENCDFNSHTRECKNCYLNTLAVKSENTHYCYWAVNDKDVVDSLITNNSELCYETIDCENCYEGVMLMDCHNCTNCFFSYELRGCENCIGCSNLRHKKNYIFNKPVSEEAFKAMKAKILNGSYERYLQGKDFFTKMMQETDFCCVTNTNCENVSGNHLINCKNCHHCYDGDNSEDCAYSVALSGTKDTYFASSAGWPGCELIFYSTVSRGCTNLKFCYYSWFSHDLEYCDSCVSCEHCFGCIGLKHKKYCILNTQYSEEAYFKLKEKIIAHMKSNDEYGRFFPHTLSTFPYNHSQAQEYFPMTRAQALERGYRWSDEEPSSKYLGESYQLPDKLSDTPDDVCEKILTCEASGKNYKIQKGELAFHRKMNLPLPRLHPDIRHEKRMKLRNPRKLWKRQCTQMGKDMLSVFDPSRPEKVLCEEAYLHLIK